MGYQGQCRVLVSPARLRLSPFPESVVRYDLQGLKETDGEPLSRVAQPALF